MAFPGMSVTAGVLGALGLHGAPSALKLQGAVSSSSKVTGHGGSLCPPALHTCEIQASVSPFIK